MANFYAEMSTILAVNAIRKCGGNSRRLPEHWEREPWGEDGQHQQATKSPRMFLPRL
jgi:hypothetical protein